MHKTNNLHEAADDAKHHVVSAIESVKARAATTAEEVGRAAQEKIHDAQDATEEALSDVASRAKIMQSEIAVYLHEQAINTFIAAVVTGLLMSLVLLFLRSNRKKQIFGALCADELSGLPGQEKQGPALDHKL